MAKRSLDPRKITPELQAQLLAAEEEAKKFNSTKKSAEQKSKAIYKNTGFNISEEMELLRKNNIVDQQWADITANATMEGPNMTDPAQMEHDALMAAGFQDKATQMQQEGQEEQEEEQPKQEQKKPLTEDEKFELVVNEVTARFGQVLNIEVLKQWKNHYMNIFILDLGDKNIFIYRYLNRQEWRQLTTDPASGWDKLNELQREEKIVEKCLLFPKYDITGKGRLPAGAFTMLSDQIQIQSMFLNPAQVADITMKI